MKSLMWVELGLANFLKPATHALFLLSLPTALVHESTLSAICVAVSGTLLDGEFDSIQDASLSASLCLSSDG
jgi:hypothetical protein